MRPVCRSAGKEMPQNPRQWGQYAADVTRPWNQGKEGASESTFTLLGLSLALLSINICQPPDVDFVPGSTTVKREWEQHCRRKQRRESLPGVTMVLWWPMPAPHSRQSSLSYFPLFSWPAHPRCTQLDPRSCLTFQRGIWHQWKLGLLCYYLCLQILQHFMAVSIACCGKARIFDCMNAGVFISPVSSFLKPVIHFRDSVL